LAPQILKELLFSLYSASLVAFATEKIKKDNYPAEMVNFSP